MSSDKVTVEKRGHLLLMGLNRVAKRNAFDLEMFQALGAAYGRLEQDDDLRCGLLFARGDHFTGGLDLPAWAPYFGSGESPPMPEGAIDPLGVYATLRSARLARSQGEPAAIARLMPDLLPLMQSEDVQEGIQSFIERREGRFTGR